jgi:phage terminase large subunit-like protein
MNLNRRHPVPRLTSMSRAARQGRMAPCEQRLQQHLEVLENVKRIDQEQYWLSLQKIVLNDYWAYLRLILRLEWIDPWFHGEELVGFIEENWGESLLILVPRDHGKSTCVTVPMPAYWVAEDALRSVIVCNATEDKAQGMTAASAAIIQNNEIYKKTFPYVVPSVRWGKSGYYMDPNFVEKAAGSVERIDAGIRAFGVGNNITGSHPDGGLILDDLINEQSSRSEVKLDQAKAFCREAITCVTGNRPILVIGTRWNEKDLYGDIIDHRIVGPRGPLKVLKMGYKRTLADGTEELVWPRRTFVDLQGRAKEAGMTWDRIKAEKINRGKLFSALYENEPIGAGDCYFDMSKVKAFSEIPFRLGPVQSVCIECESQASSLISALKMLMREQGRSMRLDEIKAAKKSKEERIKTLLGPIAEAGKLNVRDVVWHTEKSLQHEMRNFPKGHDDVIDATAYLADLCPDTEEGSYPCVTIMVDPAFTENAKSDFTAIVAGCKYMGEFYVLDISRFQTDKAEVLIRMIFSMYDRFNRAQGMGPRKKRRFMLGINSQGQRGHGSGWRDAGESHFEVDLDSFYEDTKK